MNRQRKRLNPSPALSEVTCLADSNLKNCAHCQYVIHEILAHEYRWTHIARQVILNEESVADLVQEFYATKLPRKIHQFKISDPKFRLLQYVGRMVYHFAIDELKRTSRHSILNCQRHIPGLTYESDDQVLPNVLNSIEAKDLIHYIERSLGDRDLSLFKRMLIPGWTIQEEALNEQLSIPAVRARVSRLKARIERLVNQPSTFA